MTTRQIIIECVAIPVLLLFAYTMFDLSIVYLLPPFPDDVEFLATKPREVNLPHWKLSFYFHIISSFFVILLGVSQFSKYFLKTFPKWHRRLGKIYVGLILFISAPSGLIMAFHANGGLMGQLGFITQAILWWSFTYISYKKAVQKDFFGHGKWILRSYAMTLSAVSLRIIALMAGILRVPVSYEIIYPISAWTGWGINLLIVELLIGLGLVNYYLKKT